MSHLLSHLFFVSHHSRCDTASSLVASKCLGECYAGMAALCDLWDPGWGIPGFRIELVASFTLLYGPLVFFRVVFVLLLFLAILMMTHKMSSCISFLRAGSDPTSLCFVWFLVLLCFGVFCLFVCLFLVCFMFDGIAHWTVYWSITSAFEAIDG